MTLAIRHVTRYAYEPKAGPVSLRLKLFPQSFAGQTCVRWQVTVNEDAVGQLLTDAMGDGIGHWHHQGAVDEVEIVAEGMVDTTNMAGVLKDLKQLARPGVFLRETPLTKPSDAIRALTGDVEGEDPLTRLHALSALIHKAIDYRKGATDATTTAAEAAALGAGVCQDQAHVFIAAARTMGIPARYVAGYLYDEDADEPADQTHAWAEAHVDGLGWVGFDVSNGISPDERYVRVAIGRDARDAAPTEGLRIGQANERMIVSLQVQQ